MTVAIDINADFRQINRFITQAQRRCIPRVQRQALKTTMAKVRTGASVEVRKTLNAKAGSVKKRLRVLPIRSDLNGVLIAKSDPLHLTDFTNTRQTRKGVSFQVLKSGGRRFILGAFIIKGQFSGRRVVVRRGFSRRLNREALKTRYGPSVGAHIETPQTKARVLKIATDAWPNQIFQAWRFVMEVRKCAG